MENGLELRNKVIDIALKMSRSGMAPATWGNVSARDSETGYIFITPSGMDYNELHPEDICVVDNEGKMVEGKWKPSTETPLHLLFYRERPWIGGIVHTHSIFATAFACAGKSIPVVIATLASKVGGDVPIAPYMSSGTEEFGRNALDAMGDKTAVLLANHGVVAVGNNLDDAYTTAEIVENAAKIYVISNSIGTPLRLDDNEILNIRKKYLTKYGQRDHKEE
ncbi:class II aldolase/adducin family protein [Calorimonas adulescens]|jgi:Class II Aldolase and Adducin N-terminal domain.|nr:class II aldolase/adducin family protein [Calorimonas adulescens]